MWIDAIKETPKLVEGEMYSENVLAINNGSLSVMCYSENVLAINNGSLSVMCYCYIPGDDGGFVWANCYGDINGDAEFDDDYNVTFWQPILSSEDREFLESQK